MDEAIAGTTPDQQKTVLKAFSRALGREAHVLTQYPDLLWQQLHNRLQWEEEVEQLIAPDLAQRSAPGARPWLKTTTRLRESTALHRTLTGHKGMVFDCAISPDGAWILSASEDKTLKIWDASTGIDQMTFSGHTNSIRACAISPDGRWIVSGSLDQTLKVWDALNGKEKFTLRGHTASVTACVISPNGRWIVSASNDKTLKNLGCGNRKRTSLVGRSCRLNN